ncbi:hypothetical protein H112_00219 [Trichophyton rubrum D6]|uniref:Lactamase-like protein nscB n=3 Tax=Trichophyton TaxID=5550 RepID=NSCB_TRIRC|nr:uncharacterized protein TERG_08360 [Trichophyton rubrum CBS 118892]F2T0M3.1 RecName: Full=Lactamase-like protein nscB; AltName: Full=Neosartoricin B biosynthesis protein B [Trichophyton rubrum CBS 118892]EZF27857.1 hypothetical protein H100_00219 [Trichophyton rubrum MR850]EZF46850.1 hypothetical protein H102_00218 [Trichophyton rubrum CBS 100081]EZF57499.1 hypothetical protein H103_00220 [Trichophyton rubrum CBS 288.86]EZF68100.1 hypothetical protein H104_00219 [Trichophyton rubrum CBS 289
MSGRLPFSQSFWEEFLMGREGHLPVLPELSHVSKGVIRILGGNPGSMHLQGTNTYLVGTGRSRILIDTAQGLPAWINRISSFLSTQKIELSYVLLTHWHGDHTGGVPDLIARNSSLANKIYKNQPDSGQSPITHGQIFSVDGATVRAILTPGHSVDHMCFLLEEENALFTGDNVLGHGFSVAQDLGRYMDSLRDMASLGCRIGYPAHGAMIENLPGKLEEYIQHREGRERMMLSALTRHRVRGEGTRDERVKYGLTLNEIVLAVYGRLPQEVIEKALAPSLLQVLWKLTEDRMVGFKPGDPLKRQWFALEQRQRNKVRGCRG